jgi:hypothetical protein
MQTRVSTYTTPAFWKVVHDFSFYWVEKEIRRSVWLAVTGKDVAARVVVADWRCLRTTERQEIG